MKDKTERVYDDVDDGVVMKWMLFNINISFDMKWLYAFSVKSILFITKSI